MRAEDVMTIAVATVRPETTVADAIALMVDKRVSGLPVVDQDGALVGIVTEGDLLRRVELGTERHRKGWLDFLLGAGASAFDYVRSHTNRVEDIMTVNPRSVSAETSLDDVVRAMEARHVRRLPVVKDDKLVGIVSRADLVRALGKQLRTEPAGGREDSVLRGEIVAALEKETWYNACRVAIEVKESHARITGAVFQDWVAQALRVAAERVPGVKTVDLDVEFIPEAMPMGV